MNVAQIFAALPSCYRPGKLSTPRVFYFSIGEFKYTMRLDPQTCVVEPGKTVEHADVVLKATPALFCKMVLRRERPGVIDIALGRVKTNDPSALQQMLGYFDVERLG